MTEKHPVEFELECVDLPATVPPGYRQLRLGIQEKGDVKQDIACPAERACFRFSAYVVLSPDTDGATFRGSYVQGKRGAQFIYLSWGEWADKAWRMYRRAKVPLSDLDEACIRNCLREGRPLRARIRASDERGEPVSASLRSDRVEWLD